MWFGTQPGGLYSLGGPGTPRVVIVFSLRNIAVFSWPLCCGVKAARIRWSFTGYLMTMMPGENQSGAGAMTGCDASTGTCQNCSLLQGVSSIQYVNTPDIRHWVAYKTD